MNTAAAPPLTIGQLAHATGVPTSTVRYYERVGLFKPDARTRSNYRSYSARAVERLRFIRAAQAGHEIAVPPLLPVGLSELDPATAQSTERARVAFWSGVALMLQAATRS